MKTRLYLISIVVAMLGLAGCNNNNPETTNPDNQSTNPDNQGEKSTIVVSPTEINAPKEGGEYIIEVTSSITWSVNSNASWITYDPGVGKNNGKVTVTIAASDVAEITTGVLTIGEFGGNSESKIEVVVTREAETEIPVKPLNIKFSVSADKQVQFSQGNLQYQASTNTWRFAENQYDIIGEDNKNISSTYSGWIDLFGWGTGNDPANHSTSNADYSTFTDWGVNKIFNGGNTANQWRTLTKEEWEYLFSGRTNAENFRSHASVNSVNGYVLLPDSWSLSLSEGLSFIPNANNWTTNTYSLSDWQEMEKNGAIFLPAAGRRAGSDVSGAGSHSWYWSSTPIEYYGENHAWFFYFCEDNVYMETNSCNNGRSVRLVQDVK